MKILRPLLLPMAICFLLLSGMKCKKQTTQPEPQLPAETQTGANTFGCLVDGKVFVPKGSFPYSGLSASIQFEILNFNAKNKEESTGMVIILRGFNKIGEYVITSSNDEIGISKDNQDFYAYDGKIIITKYDRVEKILSGQFYFTAKHSQTGKTISITDGRFDVKYSE